MKKLFILFSMMLCSVLYYTNTFANVIDNSSVYSETTDFYDDGYIVVEIVTNDSNNIASYSASKSKTATKKNFLLYIIKQIVVDSTFIRNF